MNSNRWHLYNSHLLAELDGPVAILRQEIAAHRGVRIGESTVVSQKVHTINPACPEEVQILQHADAGQVFYRRPHQGEVFHLDVFHALGVIDHTRVAAAIKKAVDMYNAHLAMRHALLSQRQADVVCADYIDVQTGMGGGRVTGSLRYGRCATLKKVHLHHVHLAVLMDKRHLACLFYLVWALEREIIAEGVSLRRNERLVHIMGGASQADLSPYADCNDSLIRGPEEPTADAVREKYRLLQHIGELAEQCDNPQTLGELLDRLEQGEGLVRLTEFLPQVGASGEVLEYLTRFGYARREGKKLFLTAAGARLRRFLTAHAGEVTAYLRRLLQTYTPRAPEALCRRARVAPHGKRGPAKTAQVCLRRDGMEALDMAATIAAAAGRAIGEGKTALAISPQDLRYLSRRRYLPWEFCLLVDASASMAGRRIQAAKYLARHLLVSTRDKVAVVIFQETTAQVIVPFTRDYHDAVRRLAVVTAYGSTPLALGLDKAGEFLQASRVKNPVLIIITDGVPTVAAVSRDALADAVASAWRLREKRIKLICVGLKPHRGYLEKIAQAAGGVLYVLDELEKHSLTRAIWSSKAVFLK